MLQHAQHLSLRLVIRHTIHRDKLNTPWIAARCLLEVLALTLVHDEHNTIVDCRELFV